MRGRIWVCRRRRRSGARTDETCRVAAWTRGTSAQEARVTSGTRAHHWPWHLSPQLNILQVKSIKNRRFEQRKTVAAFLSKYLSLPVMMTSTMLSCPVVPMVITVITVASAASLCALSLNGSISSIYIWNGHLMKTISETIERFITFHSTHHQ